MNFFGRTRFAPEPEHPDFYADDDDEEMSAEEMEELNARDLADMQADAAYYRERGML